MSSRPLLSEGPEAETSTRLRREIAGLERELQEAKDEATAAKQAAADSVQAIRALRKQLEPLYTALKMIFGEISRVEIEESGTARNFSTTGSTLSPKWEMLKAKLGQRESEFIDLLQHGPMTAAQLRAAARCDIKTAYRVVEKMQSSGFLSKNGGKWSLKEL